MLIKVHDIIFNNPRYYFYTTPKNIHFKPFKCCIWQHWVPERDISAAFTASCAASHPPAPCREPQLTVTTKTIRLLYSTFGSGFHGATIGESS